MKDIEHWKREGFTFEARFPNEYDLWINRNTMQKLRRYVNGQEWLSDLTTGQYAPEFIRSSNAESDGLT